MASPRRHSVENSLPPVYGAFCGPLEQRPMSSAQNNAATTAIKVKAVLSGHWIERAEIGTPNEFDHMADEELERALIERVQKLGLGDFGETEH
jgi:hypothetical protein